MALEFSEDSMREYILDHGGRVKNIELVTHFKAFLNDPDRTDEMRERFKQHVNTLATVKVDDQKEKIVVLKKKYRSDSGGGNHDIRARSEPPLNTVSDNTDGTGQSRVRSDGNLSGSPLRTSGSSSTLTSTTSTTNDSLSLGSAVSSSSLSSGDPDDVNASIISVKERAKHLNRIESESEIQKVSSSNLGAVRKKEGRKNRDADGDDSSTSSGYEPIGPIEREWLVKCSSSDYHLMHELLSKNPQLAAVKDYTSGYTALHWAAMHGRVEVIKMLMSKSRVNVNQRTNGGYTPLHLAAIQGHEAIIEILVNAFKADPNIRDYSGKKAKQYLRNSASSRAQRKSCNTALTDSTDSPIKTSITLRNSVSGDGVTLRHKPTNVVISPPSDFRKVKSELISGPTDFRHVQSANFSKQIGGFGSGSLRASVRIGPLSPGPADTTDGVFSKSLQLNDSTENASES